MRIAFFVSGFPVLTETYLLNQIVNFIDKGHEVDIYATHSVKNGQVHQIVQQYQLINRTVFMDEIPKSRFWKIIRLISWIFANFSLIVFHLVLTFIRKSSAEGISVYQLVCFDATKDYDIIHAHFGEIGVFVSRIRKLGLFNKSKFITTFHGFDLENTARGREYYNQLFHESNVITASTEYSKKKLMDLGCSNEKIRLIPMGVDTKYFNAEPYPKTTNAYIEILFVGRLIKLKGPHLIIQLSNILKKRNNISFKVRIVGDGEMAFILSKMINELNLSNEVIMMGSASQQKVKELMINSDIFLFPGLTINGRAEAQGLVVQEAQAMELPVIISDAGGTKEGIINSETGYIVPEGNLDEFVLKIETLAHDPALRRKMGLSGRKFVIENYSIDIINNRFIDLYKD